MASVVRSSRRRPRLVVVSREAIAAGLASDIDCDPAGQRWPGHTVRHGMLAGNGVARTSPVAALATAVVGHASR